MPRANPFPHLDHHGPEIRLTRGIAERLADLVGYELEDEAVRGLMLEVRYILESQWFLFLIQDVVRNSNQLEAIRRLESPLRDLIDKYDKLDPVTKAEIQLTFEVSRTGYADPVNDDDSVRLELGRLLMALQSTRNTVELIQHEDGQADDRHARTQKARNWVVERLAEVFKRHSDWTDSDQSGEELNRTYRAGVVLFIRAALRAVRWPDDDPVISYPEDDKAWLDLLRQIQKERTANQDNLLAP